MQRQRERERERERERARERERDRERERERERASEIDLSVCLFVCLSVCLSVYVSICLSICLSVILSVYLFVYLSACVHAYVCINIPAWRHMHTRTYTKTSMVDDAFCVMRAVWDFGNLNGMLVHCAFLPCVPQSSFLLSTVHSSLFRIPSSLSVLLCPASTCPDRLDCRPQFFFPTCSR